MKSNSKQLNQAKHLSQAANHQAILQSALLQLTNSQEARHYLNRYHSQDEMRFAVVKVGGGILDQELEQLAESLALLANLGLAPIVVHGAGVQLDQGLAAAGIDSQKKAGIRVTDAASMAVIRPIMYQVNQQLVAALEQQGVRASGVVHGVFESEYLDEAEYGLVGSVSKIHLSPIKQALHSGAIPVLSCLGETSSGQVLNINADVATRELVWQVNPHKIIFVTPTGGVLDANDQIISAIQLHNDFEQLMQQDWVHSGMQLKLTQIKELLEPMGPGHSVSITSSKNLARELFTHQGAGTFINLGERITEHDTLTPFLQQQLVGILQNAFGRTFRAGFLGGLPIKKVYIAESGRAAALITAGEHGHAYLHKFAVTREARGEGLAATLWQQIKHNHPQLYWRSRAHNEINTWYFKQADASMKSAQVKTKPTDNDWVGFACGLSPQESLHCLQQAFTEDSGWEGAATPLPEQSHG
ncbi:acetylglutamate kinase [Marinicella meishanensis]|uniref:acetylglutamate kinase n=1 Tax=Marinicella meishanensis TaxID=2873263 RepID=UPI001CBBA56C|nr:acetylglutamate kinase [Marinicella sp. NBU2979]